MQRYFNDNRFHAFNKFLLVAATYYLATLIGKIFILPGSLITPMWPASGIALASVMLFDYSIWPVIYLFAAVFDILIFKDVNPYSVINGLIIAIGETLEPVIGAWILRKFTRNTFSFDHVYHIFLFCICAVAAPLINASIGTIFFSLSGQFPHTTMLGFFLDWYSYWLGCVIGIITVTPAVLVWSPKYAKRLAHGDFFEIIAFVVLLILAALIIFSYTYPLNYLFVPFAIWAALRFRIQIATFISLIISVTVMLGTLYGHSEFNVGNIHMTLLLMQGFIGVICITILFISAVLSERETVYDNLRLLNKKLEHRVLQRKKDLEEKNTSLHEAMDNLKKTQSQLVQSEKMSSVGVLAAGIAHEINNSVNFISANLDPLRRDIEDILQILHEYLQLDDKPQFASVTREVIQLKTSLDLDYTLNEIHQLLKAMQDGAERTTTIVKDLRTFSRLDENAIKLINVFDNINSTLTLLKSQLTEHITIIKNDGHIPQIECYPGKINQVFMNLLLNAVQGIKGNGTIEITTRANKDTVTISFKDTGVGIPPDLLKHIFEPFYTTKDVGEGTGLGLWICYDIIKSHHGSIDVKSTVNQGSEFIITLPIKQPPG